MQMLKLILLIALASSTLCDVSDPNSMIYKVMKTLAAQIPGMKIDLGKPEKYPNEAIRKIIGNGFTYYSENARLAQFNGVDGNNLDDFIDYLSRVVKLPKDYQGNFHLILGMVRYVPFADIISTNLAFSIDKTKSSCTYVNILAQRNDDNTYDFLIGEIGASFTLAPNVLVIDSRKKSILGGLISSSSQEIVFEKRTINEENATKLFNYFEICIFEQFVELLNLTK